MSYRIPSKLKLIMLLFVEHFDSGLFTFYAIYIYIYILYIYVKIKLGNKKQK